MFIVSFVDDEVAVVECLDAEVVKIQVGGGVEGVGEFDDGIFERERIDSASFTTPSGGESPDAILSNSELRVKMEIALGKLSAEHREVVLLKDAQGLSYKEIAEAMSSSMGTVMSRLFYARQKLQALLKNEYESR